MPNINTTTDTQTSHRKLTINNFAALNNDIQLSANTGKNFVQGYSNIAETGDASAHSQLINYLNTSVIGNRWYLADVNLLAPFSGDITLAKPDLTLSSLTPVVEAQVGQRRVVGFRIANTGQSKAQSVRVSLTFPSGVAPITSEPVASIQGQQVTWTITELEANQQRIGNRLQAAPKQVDMYSQGSTGRVLGKMSELASAPITNVDAAAPQSEISMPTRKSICDSNPAICQFTPYAFAGVLGSVYLYLLRAKSQKTS